MGTYIATVGMDMSSCGYYLMTTNLVNANCCHISADMCVRAHGHAVGNLSGGHVHIIRTTLRFPPKYFQLAQRKIVGSADRPAYHSETARGVSEIPT